MPFRVLSCNNANFWPGSVVSVGAAGAELFVMGLLVSLGNNSVLGKSAEASLLCNVANACKVCLGSSNWLDSTLAQVLISCFNWA